MREQINDLKTEISANTANTTNTIEEAIRLASSQLTHSILPISCPKNKDYDDILELLTKNQMLAQKNQIMSVETDSQR
jgi:hypothetical protein